MGIIDAWNRIRLLEAFRKTTPEEGLRLCEPLSGDPAMFETRDLRGLKASGLDGVRMVRFRREQPEDLREEMAAWDEDRQRRLEEAKRSRLGINIDLVDWGGPFPRLNPDVARKLPPRLAREMEFHIEVAAILFDASADRKMYLSTFSNTTGIRRAHIDSDSTLHNTVMGAGLKLYFGRASGYTQEEGKSTRYVSGNELQAMGSVTTTQGDLTFFRGWGTEKEAEDGRTGGVVHVMDKDAVAPTPFFIPRVSLSAYN